MTFSHLAKLIELGRTLIGESFSSYLSDYGGFLKGCPMGMAYVGHLAETEQWSTKGIPTNKEIMEKYRADRAIGEYYTHDGSIMIADKLGLDRLTAMTISFTHAGGYKNISEIVHTLHNSDTFPFPPNREDAVRELVAEKSHVESRFTN